MTANEVRTYFQEIRDLGHFCPPLAHQMRILRSFRVVDPGILQACGGSEWWQSSKLDWTGF